MPTVTRKSIDRLTRRWIRNAADERAARRGCRFDEGRGQHAADWIEDYCRLYEGEYAGQLIQLIDWQRDIVMRLFGWVCHSDDWGREIRRFKRAGIWVPKKNGKSGFLAALGLYLLIGDAEPGQKVFSAAKDGKQAMISHQHAIEMVRQSPELLEECRINLSTGRITHERTRSFYSILSADNIRSQEGINGSVLIDEAHVVDRRLAKVIRRAGISRSEPLQISVSTAGNNPDGWGKEQFDYGQKVQSGEFDNDGYLFSGFYAPQNTEPKELADEERLIELGKLANPSWGHTIKPSEFIADYNEVRHSLSDTADFLMYRLNVWQHSSNPWLSAADWKKCRGDFTLDELEGQRCWAGLDLSRTRDTTSLQLCFDGEDEEKVRLVSFFWLPEEEAQRQDHLVTYSAWAEEKHIILTPGNVVSYKDVKKTIVALSERFDIQCIFYDDTFAEDLTQQLEDEHGIPRMSFGQGWQNFACPTAEFERHVIGGMIEVFPNPVMDWQIGHAAVKTGDTGNKRVVKPKKNDYRKVDGVVAAIMALAGYLQKDQADAVEIVQTSPFRVL